MVFEGLQAEGAGGETICVAIFTTGSPAFDGGDWVAVGGAHGERRGSSGCEAMAGGGDRGCGTMPASHRALCVKGVHLPPYSPESCGWVFEEARRWIEGRIYGSIEAKVAAVRGFFEGLSGG